MSQLTTEKPHHSWVAPSSQSSQSIIENRTEPSPAAEVDNGQQQQQTFTNMPPLPRRSSHNYEQDSARFSGFSAEKAAEKTGGSDGGGKPAHHARQKSFSREDQKRLAHAFMMTEGDEKSFTEKD
jgi:hypothetical protein